MTNMQPDPFPGGIDGFGFNPSEGALMQSAPVFRGNVANAGFDFIFHKPLVASKIKYLMLNFTIFVGWHAALRGQEVSVIYEDDTVEQIQSYGYSENIIAGATTVHYGGDAKASYLTLFKPKKNVKGFRSRGKLWEGWNTTGYYFIWVAFTYLHVWYKNQAALTKQT